MSGTENKYRINVLLTSGEYANVVVFAEDPLNATFKLGLPDPDIQSYDYSGCKILSVTLLEDSKIAELESAVYEYMYASTVKMIRDRYKRIGIRSDNFKENAARANVARVFMPIDDLINDIGERIIKDIVENWDELFK